jgi:predicted nucleic acid-binding protein
MNVFVDTNILLDVILNRSPFAQHSKLILELGLKKKIRPFTSATAISTAHYIIESNRDSKTAFEAVIRLNELFEIVEVNQNCINKSIACDPLDFEDATQYYCAKFANCEVIISRDKKGFKQFDIPCKSPKEFLDSL